MGLRSKRPRAARIEKVFHAEHPAARYLQAFGIPLIGNRSPPASRRSWPQAGSGAGTAQQGKGRAASALLRLTVQAKGQLAMGRDGMLPLPGERLT